MPKKPASAVDEAFDELYSIEPSAFVARRNALAAERKAAGDDAGAAAIKAALKPTVSAAIVNQLVRAKPALVDELMAATTEVVRAQLGSKGRTYQEALADRKAMEQRVNDELHALGASEAVVHRAMASLRAGSLTAETRDLIRAGHLSKDLEMPDVDVLLEGVSAPKKRPAPRSPRRSIVAPRSARRSDRSRSGSASPARTSSRRRAGPRRGPHATPGGAARAHRRREGGRRCGGGARRGARSGRLANARAGPQLVRHLVS